MIAVPLLLVIFPAVLFLGLEAIRDLARKRGYPTWPFLVAVAPALVFGLLGLGAVYLGMFLFLGRRRQLSESWQCPDCRFIQEPATLICSCGYDRRQERDAIIDGVTDAMPDDRSRSAGPDERWQKEDKALGLALGALGLLGWLLPPFGLAVSGFAVHLGTVTRKRGHVPAGTAAQVLGIIGFVAALAVYIVAPGAIIRP